MKGYFLKNNGLIIRGLLLISFFIYSSDISNAQSQSTEDANEKRKIQIALILDTSNSMDGLIDQAKSQLWSIVGTMSGATYEGKDPILEIALYEYGNDGLSSENGYIRQILPLVTDLDDISSALFSLKTNGGSEYCGMVIQKSLNELEWSRSYKDIKMIFVAGNEPFTQGSVNYLSACGNARAKDVIVNTIHCGSFDKGIYDKWKDGALVGGGDYMAIQQDRRTVHIQTPYDDRINELSIELNNTYIYYGNRGYEKKVQQEREDINASGYSKSYLAKRNSIKASKYYKNESWDLVDAYEADSIIVETTDKAKLPAELQDMTTEELEKYVKKQQERRKALQLQIQVLNAQRDKFIKNKQQSSQVNLGSSMFTAIKKQAIKKKYTIE